MCSEAHAQFCKLLSRSTIVLTGLDILVSALTVKSLFATTWWVSTLLCLLRILCCIPTRINRKNSWTNYVGILINIFAKYFKAVSQYHILCILYSFVSYLPTWYSGSVCSFLLIQIFTVFLSNFSIGNKLQLHILIALSNLSLFLSSPSLSSSVTIQLIVINDSLLDI